MTSLNPYDQSSFQKLLAPTKFGLAYLHPEWPVDHEIEIGDVGFFQNNGQFVFILNVTESINDEISTYKQLDIKKILDMVVDPFLQPGRVTKSEGVKQREDERSAVPVYKYYCCSNILMIQRWSFYTLRKIPGCLYHESNVGFPKIRPG